LQFSLQAASPESFGYALVHVHVSSTEFRTKSQSFQNVGKLEYLGTKAENKDDVHDEFRSRLYSGGPCSLKNLVPSSDLFKKNFKD
jgi:hypothetical protein